MITDEQIDELERLEREATPGYWSNTHDNCPRSNGILCGSYWVVGNVGEGPCGDIMSTLDARLIAAARNALPALLAELRELRAYKQQVERVKSCESPLCILGERYYYETYNGTCEACGGLP